MGVMSNKIQKEQLKIGDHIYTWRRAFIYAHHGIYVGDGKVIHFTQAAGQDAGAGNVFDSVIFSSAPSPVSGYHCPICDDQSKVDRSKADDESKEKVDDESKEKVDDESKEKVGESKVFDESKEEVDDESKGKVDDESKDESNEKVDDESKENVDEPMVVDESKEKVDDEPNGKVDDEPKGKVDDQSKGKVDGESEEKVDDESKEKVDEPKVVGESKFDDKSKGKVDDESKEKFDDESKAKVDESKVGGVISSCLDCFLSGGDLYRFEYGVNIATFLAETRGGTCTLAFAEAEEHVLHRASVLLENGFGTYDLFKNNCIDFAVYCKTSLLVDAKLSVRRCGQVVSLLADASNFIFSKGLPLLFLAKRFPCAMALGGGVYVVGKVLSDIGIRPDAARIAVEDLVNGRR